VKPLTTEQMLEEAKASSNIRLEDYIESIDIWQRKGYSLREIASFLTKFGVRTDHTAVYRLLRKRKQESYAPAEADSVPAGHCGMH